MIERRQYPRVGLTTKSVLRYRDADYRGQLENISIRGALVRLEQSVVLSLGGEYILTIYIEDESTPLQLIVEVVCATPCFAGLKFVSSNAETAARLEQLVRELTPDPKSTVAGPDTIRLHLENYLR
jgi:c-di-GMP-binding flagellar brake protein YcgR